jgi:menaquinone-9 beta-reductase
VELGAAESDVFIVGGGPAGLAAAIAARKKGFSVTVADGAEPFIDKACGEGMMPDARAALQEIGAELPADLGVRFRGIRFLQKGASVAADFPHEKGIGIRRTLLHEFLIRQAEACGVKLLWRTPITGISGNEVRLNRGTVPARWIVAADGSRSRVRRWSGMDSAAKNSYRFALRRHYRIKPWTDYTEVYWGAGMQAYVTPISNQETCIVAMGASAEKIDFQHVLGDMPQLREHLASADWESRERGAMSATVKLARVWRGNVALVGDASGGVDAITGEGLRLAFRQAQALAEAMHAGDLRGYGREHEKLMRRPLQMGRLMLYLGRHDKLRSRMFRMLNHRPDLFARLLATHVGCAPMMETVSTGAQLGWRLLFAGERG